MTEHEIMMFGAQAEQLLQSEAFQDIFERILDDMGKAILQTRVGDAEIREKLFLTVHGMTLFRDSLIGFKSAKDNLLTRQDEDDELASQSYMDE